MYGERAHTLLRCFTCRASWWWCIGVMAPKRKSREVNSATLPIVHGFSRSGTNLLKTPLALDKTSLLSFSVSQTTESGAKANLKTEFVLIRNCVVKSTFFCFNREKPHRSGLSRLPVHPLFRMKRLLLFVILCIQSIPIQPSASKQRQRRHTPSRNPLADLTQAQLTEFLGFMLSQSTNTIIVAGHDTSTILTNDRHLQSNERQLSRSKRNRYFTPRLNRAVINQFSQKMHCIVFKSYNLPGCGSK